MKLLSEYHISKTILDGHHGKCKICKNAYEAMRRKNFTDEQKNKLKDLQLQNDFGITLEEYNEIFVRQNGKCAICGKHQIEFKRALCVDHCHETGNVRGLLCLGCNTGIGSLNDDIENLNCAIIYLTKQMPA